MPADPADCEYLKTLKRAIHRKRCGDDPRDMLTLSQMAEATGLSKTTLCRVLQGQTPTLEAFRALCRWTGQSADALLGLSASSPSAPVSSPAPRPLQPPQNGHNGHKNGHG